MMLIQPSLGMIYADGLLILRLRRLHNSIQIKINLHMAVGQSPVPILFTPQKKSAAVGIFICPSFRPSVVTHIVDKAPTIVGYQLLLTTVELIQQLINRDTVIPLLSR